MAKNNSSTSIILDLFPRFQNFDRKYKGQNQNFILKIINKAFFVVLEKPDFLNGSKVEF